MLVTTETYYRYLLVSSCNLSCVLLNPTQWWQGGILISLWFTSGLFSFKRVLFSCRAQNEGNY